MLNDTEFVIKTISSQTPIDRIISITTLYDCWEVVGEAGGDILRYKVRKDGSIT